jgi:hypothetical protein
MEQREWGNTRSFSSKKGWVWVLMKKKHPHPRFFEERPAIFHPQTWENSYTHRLIWESGKFCIESHVGAPKKGYLQKNLGQKACPPIMSYIGEGRGGLPENYQENVFTIVWWLPKSTQFCMGSTMMWSCMVYAFDIRHRWRYSVFIYDRGFSLPFCRMISSWYRKISQIFPGLQTTPSCTL